MPKPKQKPKARAKPQGKAGKKHGVKPVAKRAKGPASVDGNGVVSVLARSSEPSVDKNVIVPPELFKEHVVKAGTTIDFEYTVTMQGAYRAVKVLDVTPAKIRFSTGDTATPAPTVDNSEPSDNEVAEEEEEEEPPREELHAEKEGLHPDEEDTSLKEKLAAAERVVEERTRHIIEKLQADNLEMSKVAEEIGAKMGEMKEELFEKQTANDSLQATVDELQKKKPKPAPKASKASDNSQALKAELAKANCTIEELKTAKGVNEAAMTKLSSEKNEIEEAHKILLGELAEMQKLLTAEQQTKKRTNEQLAEVRQLLAAANQKADNATTEVLEEKQRSTVIREELGKVKKELVSGGRAQDDSEVKRVMETTGMNAKAAKDVIDWRRRDGGSSMRSATVPSGPSVDEQSLMDLLKVTRSAAQNLLRQGNGDVNTAANIYWATGGEVNTTAPIVHTPRPSWPPLRPQQTSKPHPASQRVFVIRHGERGDTDEFKRTSPRPFDPPLTTDGVQQAKDAGARIAKLLNGQPVRIVTSPYERCLSTAKEIAGEVGFAEIEVHFGLSEFHSKATTVNRTDKRWVPTFDESALQGYPVVGGSLPSYPEHDDAYQGRVRSTLRTLANSPHTVTVMVTHGPLVVSAAHHFSLFPSRQISSVDYCTFIDFSRDQRGSWGHDSWKANSEPHGMSFFAA